MCILFCQRNLNLTSNSKWYASNCLFSGKMQGVFSFNGCEGWRWNVCQLKCCNQVILVSFRIIFSLADSSCFDLYMNHPTLSHFYWLLTRQSNYVPPWVPWSQTDTTSIPCATTYTTPLYLLAPYTGHYSNSYHPFLIRNCLDDSTFTRINRERS